MAAGDVQTWLLGLVVAELPVFSGVIIARMEKRTNTLRRIESRLELDANEDITRDRELLDLRRRSDADHDLLVETTSAWERHERWHERHDPREPR